MGRTRTKPFETPPLTEIVCWTRMQAEAGQDIRTIIARKELERRSGNGLFFWGIGNAPSRSAKGLAIAGEEVDVVFSLMKSRPKLSDVAPSGILAWRTYFDADDIERPVPPTVLVTSRMTSATSPKRVHYALMCWADKPLQLEDHGVFDPAAYRNIGDAGGPVGSTQVTALLVRTRTDSRLSDYRINLRAKLTGGYWVRLARPCVLKDADRRLIAEISESAGDVPSEDWIAAISKLRLPSQPLIGSKNYLF